MTERLHFHFPLSCIGKGNGNPLQCSCLENPRDGGAWWAAVYGVTQSRTRLKRLSSSSSIKAISMIFVFISLTYFVKYDNLRVHPCGLKWHYFILFIHSSVDGPLGFFHVFTVLNSAVRNIGVHMSFRILLFCGYMPRNGIT